MNTSTLSVLIPNYNHARYIGEALTTVMSQSYRPNEIIIIDDASTDNSLEVIQQFIKRYPEIRLIINEKNVGVNNNLNKLLELAKGDYVHFAAADDKILPGFYEKSMNLLEQYPQAGLCSALTLCIDEEGRNMGLHNSFIISPKQSFITPEKTNRINKNIGNWLAGIARIYKREALLNSGRFIPELHSFSDGFISQVIALKYGACFIPEALACFRIMNKGYSMSFNSDFDVREKIIRNAAHLMRTAYSRLFSERYISSFEKMELSMMSMERLAFAQKKRINQTRNDSNQQHLSGKILMLLNGALMKIERANYMLYLFGRGKLRLYPMTIGKFIVRINRLLHFSNFKSCSRIKTQ